jgi:hypothetical protein
MMESRTPFTYRSYFVDSIRPIIVWYAGIALPCE